MALSEVHADAGDQKVEDAAGPKWHTMHRRSPDRDGVHRTRIGGAWVAVAVAVVLGVALIDFIVQNTRSVRVEFFGANGQMPVAVALLGAALAGAFLVLAVGVARTTQLRIATRRGKKREKQAAKTVAEAEAAETKG